MNNPKTDQEILLNILSKLENMSNNLEQKIDILSSRIDQIEGKTNDIHQYVPFVGWLEGVGHVVSKKWSWLKGIPDVPLLTVNEENNDMDVVNIE
jgi:hypothetical protein